MLGAQSILNVCSLKSILSFFAYLDVSHMIKYFLKSVHDESKVFLNPCNCFIFVMMINYKNQFLNVKQSLHF